MNKITKVETAAIAALARIQEARKVYDPASSKDVKACERYVKAVQARRDPVDCCSGHFGCSLSEGGLCMGYAFSELPEDIFD